MSLEVIKEASAAGVRLFLSNGQLKVMAEKGALTPQLKQRILAAKKEVMALLAQINTIGSQEEAQLIKPALRKAGGLPLSFQQQRLWVLNEIQQGSSEYNIPMAFTVRGRFAPDTAEQAMRAIVSRHEVLRSNYFPAASSSPDSGALQRIRSDADFRLERMDLSPLDGERKAAAVDAALLAQATKVFDLQQDFLLRAIWIQLEAETGVLGVNMHHIVADEWSIEILMREFMALYEAFSAGRSDPLLPLPIQYSDYAVWQRQHLTETRIEQQADYWRNQLADAPLVHSLPMDFPRPAQKSNRGAAFRRTLPPAVVDKLNALASRNGMTLFMLIHAALGVLIARHGDGREATIGTSLANRLNWQLEPLIGFFVNQLALRTRVDEAWSVLDYLRHVKEVNVAAQSNQDLPFDVLLEQLQIPRSMSHAPVFQITLSMHNMGKSAPAAQGPFTVEPRSIGAEFAQYDLTVHASADRNGLELNWTYDISLFQSATIERYSRYLNNILSALALADGGRVRDLVMLSPEDRQLAAELNDTRRQYDAVTPVHAHVARQAASSPDKLAVTCGNESIHYRQLETKANCVAGLLRKRGVKAGQRVGIAVIPSIDMVVAVLAVMKVGGVYVPVAVDDSRLQAIVTDSAMNCLLVDSGAAARLTAFADRVVVIDTVWPWQVEDVPAVEPPGADSPVCILHAADATGSLKGVAITGRSLANYLSHARREYMKESLRGAVMSAPLTSAAAITTLLTPLICGKELVILPGPQAELAAKLSEYLFAREGVWLFKLTPAQLDALAVHLSEQVRGNDAGHDAGHDPGHVIVVGGEPLYKKSVRALRRAGLVRSVLINEYGQTETLGGCATHAIHPSDQLSGPAAAVPIGRPIQNVQALVIKHELPVVDLDADASLWQEQSVENPDPRALALSSRHLAYLIYTSGSTGQPKGVMIEHRSIINRIAWQYSTFGITREDSILQRTSISFDASAWEIFMPLMIGGRSILLPQEAEKDPARIIRTIERQGVTVAQFVPTLLRAVLAHSQEDARLCCRYIFSGGEPLDRELAENARAHTITGLVNLYGPTEVSIDGTAWPVTPERVPDQVPIGRPLANMRVYILDATRQPVPVGVAGEIYIGGVGVARGYLNRAALTAERFLESPFVPGDRLYKTGDLGRLLADGTIEFLGRNDSQVKIRGVRIELAEIEARLGTCEGVREAAVEVREITPGDKRLVAYYTTSTGAQIDVETLKSHLSRTLTSYMVPATYMHLAALPLTPNGKLDRKSLPAPQGSVSGRGEHEALGDTEEPTTPFGLSKLLARDEAIAEAVCSLDSRLSTRIRQCARTLGLSTASIFHVAWAQLISRASGRPDPVFGTVLSPVADMLPLKVCLTDRSVEQCVRETHEQLVRLRQHGAVSAGAPLFTAALIYRDHREHPAAEARSDYPLTLSVADEAEEFAFTARVAPSIGAERINAMTIHVLEQVSDALESNPARSMSELDVLPEQERRRLLVEWNETQTAYPGGEGCLHEIFEAQVARHPEAIAVVFEDRQLSYAELNRRANQLAHQLRALGVGPDRLVALCMERSLEMVVGLVAILKAGAGYLPLDPAYPIERLSYMLRDSSAVLVLTHAAARGVVQAATRGLGRASLAPLGAIGELHIAGDAVAYGYVDNDELQARSFVSMEVAPDSTHRLYRTGDLVRYNSNRELEYLGRADEQIIVRGLRVEPGEIQARLCEHPQVEHAVVLAAQNGASSLVAFVVPSGPVAAGDEESFLASLQEWTKKHLAAHLQPAAYKLIQELPLTRAGKVDQRALLKLQLFAQTQGSQVPPRNDVERILCEVYAGLLDVEQIGVHDNFFALGGDSILSIQAVSRARKAGIGISASKIFTYQTVAELAQVAEVESVHARSSAEVAGEMPLLPIHSLFFSLDSVAVHHYNQSVLLEVPPVLSVSTLSKLVRALYLRHDALRLRFASSDGQWQARFVPFDESLCEQSCGVEALPQAGRIEERCQHYQRSLNLETGPLFRAVHFTIGADQHRLLLVLHHAIVDGVSWRVLIADIEQALKQSRAGQDIDLPGRGSSYKDWSVALQRYSRSDELLAEQPYWLRQLQVSAELAVDSSTDVSPRHADSKELVVQLSKEETRRLLGKCSQAYSMRTAELLIAAMAMGLSRWMQRDAVLIELEGHGREELFPDLDIGDTVGWFTTVYPVALTGGLQPVPQALVAVKEQVRAIPRNGIGYGVLRHLAQDSQIVAAERGNAPQLIFNYLGQLDQTVESDSELSLAAEHSGQQISPERSRSHKVGVNAMVLGGVLRLVWDYSASEFNEGTIARAAQHVLGSLREAIEHCANVVDRVYTPSDFPDADVSMAQLRDWQQQYSFGKLYRVTPAQQGMLAASELERATYVNQVYQTLRGSVDKALLEQAWQAVVDRHDILRTVFVSNDHGIHQLVLSDHAVELPVIDLRGYPESEREAVFARHRREDESAGFPLNSVPAHRMALFRMGEDRFRILFTNHHAILDGWSMAIVFNELFAAYRSGKPPRSASGAVAPDYEKYVSWLCRQPVHEAKQFWKRYLGDIGETALLRPASSLRLSSASYSERSALLSEDETDRLKDFASRHRATLSTVAQLAWSLVLRDYTGRRAVVFGAVVSGRPAEVAGVENMVGLFVNTIPVRIELDDAPIPQLLARIQLDLVASNRHAYLSLIDIKRQAQVRGDLDMFETIVDFKNYPDVSVGGGDAGALIMEEQSAHDRNSFPVTLMIGARDKLAVHCCYRDDLLPPAFVNSMIDDLVHVLRVLPDADALAAIRLPGYEKITPLTRLEPARDQAQEGISSAARERPATELENRLCRLLAAVLGVDAVGVHDNFFDLGGDSMLALRLRGLAQKQEIPVSVAQIYRLQTVAMIAAGIEGQQGVEQARAASVGKQPLLPIQQQILVARSGHDLNKLRHFNMAALFNVPQTLGIDALRAAAEAILKRHDALRLEFAIEAGVWCGRYRDYDERMLDAVCRCEQIPAAEIESRCRVYHEAFDLSQAPLIRLVKFESPTQARLFLVAHHSVVDVLSSQVLVSDLRTAFKQYAETGVVALGGRPDSYQQWGSYLNECAARGSFAGERDYWLRQMPAVAQQFDCERDLDAPATFGNLAHAMVRLAQDETACLLRECQSFHDASINEMLIAALYRALRHWSGRSTHSLFVMSHGRHSAELDLSETVGWFTDMYPLALEQGGIEYVKEQYRAVPNHGMGYGVLRHLCQDSELEERERRYSPQVVLNYSGQLDGMVRDAGYLEFSAHPSGPIASDEHEMPYKLVFQGGVYSGCLAMGIEYNKRRFAAADIRSLADAFRAELLKLVETANSAVAIAE